MWRLDPPRTLGWTHLSLKEHYLLCTLDTVYTQLNKNASDSDLIFAIDIGMMGKEGGGQWSTLKQTYLLLWRNFVATSIPFDHLMQNSLLRFFVAPNGGNGGDTWISILIPYVPHNYYYYENYRFKFSYLQKSHLFCSIYLYIGFDVTQISHALTADFLL